MKRILRWSVVTLVLVTLAGCHSLFGSDDDSAKKADSGKRVAALEESRKLTPDKGLDNEKPILPSAVVNRDWPLVGGNSVHTLLHPALAAKPQEFWRADIGAGSGGYYKLLAQPVVFGGRIFTLDAKGEVRAFRASTGERLWAFDTTPADVDEEAIGGGLGVAGGALYVTTGFGEVLALRLGSGNVLWRKTIGKPFRAAPTVADGRVYVVSIDNELNTLDAKTGEVLWHHNGIAENATLMGASSPAVAGDSVIVTYSSGEVFNLRVQNGRVDWVDVLAVPEQVGALPAIADIHGHAVVDRGLVFAVSHSGRMAAIDQRTGERAWEVDIGGINTPVVAGNMVFVLSNDNELVAMTRDSGRVFWVRNLAKLDDPTDHDSDPVFWYGPLLAGGRLWLTNSLGHLVSFAVVDGAQLEDRDLAGRFFLPPIVANDALFLVKDNGTLIALK